MSEATAILPVRGMAAATPILVLLVAWLSAGLAAAEPASGEDCTGHQSVRLVGEMRDTETVSLGPARSETRFRLVLAKPWCGLTSIRASLPGVTYCAPLVVQGDFAPPPAPDAVLAFRHDDLVACPFERPPTVTIPLPKRRTR